MLLGTGLFTFGKPCRLPLCHSDSNRTAETSYNLFHCSHCMMLIPHDGLRMPTHKCYIVRPTFYSSWHSISLSIKFEFPYIISIAVSSIAILSRYTSAKQKQLADQRCLNFHSLTVLCLYFLSYYSGKQHLVKDFIKV